VQTAGGNAFENREPEINITLQENTKVFSQRGSTADSVKIRRCIALKVKSLLVYVRVSVACFKLASNIKCSKL
jgi:hypothetical protein